MLVTILNTCTKDELDERTLFYYHHYYLIFHPICDYILNLMAIYLYIVLLFRHKVVFFFFPVK